MIEMRVLGLRELGEILRSLPPEIGSKAGGPLKRALFKAGKLVRDTAIEYAPISSDDEPGQLKRAIKIRRDPHPGNVTERYVVRVSTRGKDAAPHWRFPEFGVDSGAPHPRHQVAQAYMRRAAKDTFPAAVLKFREELTRELDRIVKKLRRRSKRG